MRQKLAAVLLVLVGALTWVASASASPASVHAPLIMGPTNATQYSSNWAGYAASGSRGTFTAVSASWTVPAVSGTFCSSNPNSYSSFWVGLDGYGSNSVEQIGTDSDCLGTDGTTPTYSAWYEMYPKGPDTFTYDVKPGDVITASVTSGTARGSFDLTLTDTRNDSQVFSETFNKTFRGAKHASVEAIAERPAFNLGPFGFTTLANFGQVPFTNVKVNFDPQTPAGGHPIGYYNPDSFTMQSLSGATLAYPSALTSGGFTVTWGAPTG